MPHKDPVKRAAYRKQYNDAHREKRNTQSRTNEHNKAQRFVGIDGEGGNVGPNERHEYLLLRAGDYCLETGSPLSTNECFEFLCGLPTDVEYVAYFFTYDVTMMLRDVSAKTVMEIFNRAARTNYDGIIQRVRYGCYLLDWLPGKEFRIRRVGRYSSTKWVVISDVGSFFQCSFVEALEKWNIGSIPLRRRIAASKAKRSGFTHITPLTRLYNKKECDLLAELMTEFRDVVGSVGPYPRQWQGPGNLAAAWLRHYKVPHEQNVPYEAMKMARNGYYGGRFEITGIGSIRRKIYQYDINSAYPAVIRGLPCLVHGAWRHRTNASPRTRIYIARVEFTHLSGRFLGTLPIRSDKGNISYPREGKGIYWSVELAAAKRAGCMFTVLESWEYLPDCKCKPLEWVDDIYQLRRKVGKTNKGMALKLALNSIYGKFAQSIGTPRWANPVWAGLITASTRAQIIDACRQVKQENILMIATDGIFSDTPLKLPISSELGDWELTEHSWMFIIQPGLYMLPLEKPKTRGVPRVKIVEYSRSIRKSWAAQSRSGPNLTQIIPMHRFRAARQAIHERNWEGAGEWYTQQRNVSFQWDTKRSSDNGTWDRLWSGYAEDTPAWRPGIIENGGDTVYYGKDIGMWNRIRAYDTDQPEGADILI